MQRKVPAENDRATAVHVDAATGLSCPGPRAKRTTPAGIMSARAEIDEVSLPSRDSRTEHQADDCEGIGRFVQDGREEDAPPGGTHPPTLREVGRDRACECHATDQGMDAQAERRGAPGKGFGRGLAVPVPVGMEPVMIRIRLAGNFILLT